MFVINFSYLENSNLFRNLIVWEVFLPRYESIKHTNGQTKLPEGVLLFAQR